MSDAGEILRRRRMAALAEVAKIDSLIAEIEPPGKTHVSLKEFLEEAHDFDWLVGGMLARGSVSMFVADPGIGKSTLMAQLTLSLSIGRSFLSGNVPRSTRVLMLQAEGARGAFRGRVQTAARSLGMTGGTPPWFIQAADFRDFAIGGAGLERLVRESGAELVVLDTIGFFAQYDENSSTEWKSRVAVPLKALAAQTGAAFILVHHQPKVTEANKGNREGRGSGAMLGDVDHFWKLDAVPGEPGLRDLVVRKNKYGMEPVLRLAFDAGNAVFRETDERVVAPPVPVQRPPLRIVHAQAELPTPDTFIESRAHEEEP